MLSDEVRPAQLKIERAAKAAGLHRYTFDEYPATYYMDFSSYGVPGIAQLQDDLRGADSRWNDADNEHRQARWNRDKALDAVPASKGQAAFAASLSRWFQLVASGLGIGAAAGVLGYVGGGRSRENADQAAELAAGYDVLAAGAKGTGESSGVIAAVQASSVSTSVSGFSAGTGAPAVSGDSRALRDPTSASDSEGGAGTTPPTPPGPALTMPTLAQLTGLSGPTVRRRGDATPADQAGGQQSTPVQDVEAVDTGAAPGTAGAHRAPINANAPRTAPVSSTPA